MSTSETMLVRLKAHDPKRGHHLRCFSMAGMKFLSTRGWYSVPSEVAEYLRGVRQVDGDSMSPLAFDVCSEAEAQALEVREQEEREQRSAMRAITAEPRPRPSVRESVRREGRRDDSRREEAVAPTTRETRKDARGESKAEPDKST